MSSIVRMPKNNIFIGDVESSIEDLCDVYSAETYRDDDIAYRVSCTIEKITIEEYMKEENENENA